MEKEIGLRIGRQLVENARLPESEVELRLARAVDPDYWCQLNPTLQLSDGGIRCPNIIDGYAQEVSPLATDDIESIRKVLAVEGYFKTNLIFSEARINPMKKCVDVLRRANWPPVFSFVYDEFWTIIRESSLSRLLTVLLGSGYSQNSNLWTYYLIPRKQSAGWPPHVDGYGEQHVTIWIPLTDATLDNGCIYVVPRNLTPDSLRTDFLSWESVNRSDLQKILQSIRALPARAGTVLGWDHKLIHWGSLCQDSAEPRISIAMEFLGPGLVPSESERPLVDAFEIPSFPKRLHIIAKCILAYRKIEVLMSRYAGVAERLMAIAKTSAPGADP